MFFILFNLALFQLLKNKQKSFIVLVYQQHCHTLAAIKKNKKIVMCLCAHLCNVIILFNVLILI